MMSILAAPVLLLMSATLLSMSLAVVTFDCEVLYEKLWSSSLLQPSVSKFLIIVFQTVPLSAHPWTNKIGSFAPATAAGASAATVASAAASSILRIYLPLRVERLSGAPYATVATASSCRRTILAGRFRRPHEGGSRLSSGARGSSRGYGATVA